MISENMMNVFSILAKKCIKSFKNTLESMCTSLMNGIFFSYQCGLRLAVSKLWA